MTRAILALAVPVLAMLGVGCDASVGNTSVVEQRATERLAEKLGSADFLQVHNVRAIDSGDREKICGTVSYNRGGVPSAGAERFVVLPGIVAIEGQPVTTFTFEYLYEEAGCAA